MALYHSESCAAQREMRNGFRLTAWLLLANVVLMFVACVRVYTSQ